MGQLKFYKLYKTIATDGTLTLNQKLILMIIYNIYANDNYCYASNLRIAKNLNISHTCVNDAIPTLIEEGFIDTTLDEKGHRIIIPLMLEIFEDHYYQFEVEVIHSRLKPSSKFILTYINSFQKDGKRCYSTNKIIEDHLGIKKESLRSAISELTYLNIVDKLNANMPSRELRVMPNYLLKLQDYSAKVKNKQTTMKKTSD